MVYFCRGSFSSSDSIRKFIIHLEIGLVSRLTFFLSWSDPFQHNHFRCRGLLFHLITLSNTHTHTFVRTSLDKGSARRIDLYLTTHTIHKRQISMSPAEFEPAIPASEFLCPRGQRDRPVSQQRGCKNKAPHLLSRDFA